MPLVGGGPAESPVAGSFAAASPVGVPSWISSARQAANWSTSFALTSASTPRPNCAGLPVIARSVSTSMSVLAPLSMSRQVMVAFAVPVPRVSLPLASMTAIPPGSSSWTNFALPPYVRLIGPSLTLT